MDRTQIHATVDFDRPGKQLGHLCVPYSYNLGGWANLLLPVAVVARGLTNYWGYNSIAFFAPDARYAVGGSLGQQVVEFKQMVKALHAAGIEVILDVVYNHTAEGNHLGPTVSFRGIDNPVYYRLAPDHPRLYVDVTGTGNTVNVQNPETLRMVMNSLRYWVQEMHVDGFRFDLAPALAREAFDVDREGSFFDAVHQDPVLANVKLIAEPWDIGENGYHVGGGLERQFSRNAYGKIEYVYTRLRGFDFTTLPGPEDDFDRHQVKLGLGLRM